MGKAYNPFFAELLAARKVNRDLGHGRSLYFLMKHSSVEDRLSLLSGLFLRVIVFMVI